MLLRNDGASKLDMPFIGPFVVEKVLSELNLVVRIGGKSKTVTVQRVVPFRGVSADDGTVDDDGKVDVVADGSDKSKSNVIAGDDDTFEVDHLLQYRESDGKYLVLWKGFPVADATWQLPEDITSEAIHDYWTAVQKDVASILVMLV